MSIQTIRLIKDTVRIIDQTKLPAKLVYIDCKNINTLWHAIKELKVRGAPALGVAAGFGVLLGLKTFKGNDRRKFDAHFNKVCDYIGSSRPTAVNLFNVLNEMRHLVAQNPSASVTQIKAMLKRKARTVYEHDQAVCRQMGDFGAELINDGDTLMTICNAGALATVDYGTALGVMYSAKKLGKKFKVFACETRPLLQGARLTAWELTREKIPTTLICDNMAATVMRQGKIKMIFTGADRIAGNGDAANKIGTYSLAVLAHHHKIPFYIVAPRSTFDFKIKSGEEIPIEERSREEVINFAGRPTAPKGVHVYNPAFDVTPRELITGIVTEFGIIYPPFDKNIKERLEFGV